ncbi:heme biosynthesis HemY N-terminal domain-containing protein [Oleiagrimonas sp.]|jgi:HemY protein|uniref:heme biosynthesis HemY N-terminal domain-containing protein n=1 Tax=Oleiagrimonas sp. TaxID=2010330 RepID=UPI002626FA44|nr:heme biosynthesis HemY N-terminal domain-containing protein [Oleiagrimonas sp.]MDA3913341.1 tetratricopeptide repeat protein [Oleiagrimonas sp.]
MRVWRWVLLLAVVAALAAYGWHWVAEDPGQVLVHIRGWQVQTSVVGAIVLLLLFWLLLTFCWWLVRWPFGAITRRQRRISRARLHEGLVALAEGRHGEAERDLVRAARHAPQRGAAWLAAASAASARGDSKHALEALDQATQSAPQAARVMRARIQRLDGRADEALAMLAPAADAGKLPPAGWRELAEAGLANGDLDRARLALVPLRKSGALDAHDFGDLQNRVLAAALTAATGVDAVNSLWSKLERSQRRTPELIAAYATRVAALGRPLPAMDEIESALRRQWSSLLVLVYGRLEGPDLEGRLRRAEGWLDGHPGDAALLAALGRMCVRIDLWGKARQYLSRAIDLEPTADAWEALGEAFAGQGNALLAQQCYRNALHMTRGEPIQPLPGMSPAAAPKGPIDPEERDVHGVPHLPASNKP